MWRTWKKTPVNENDFRIKKINCCLLFLSLDENEEVIELYWKTEQKARKFSKWCGYYVLFHTSAFTIVLMYALSCLARGRYDTSSWYLSFDILLPFDKTKVTGWFCTWGVQFSMAFSYSLGITAVTGYFVCCCNYISTMCDHFKWIITKVRIEIEKNQIEKHPQKAIQNLFEINKLVDSAVVLHVKIYEWVMITIVLDEFISIFQHFYTEFSICWRISTAVEYFGYFRLMLFLCQFQCMTSKR